MAPSLNQSILFRVILVGSVFWLLASPSIAELPRFKHPVKADQPLNFLVVGDWGRKGTHNQSLVANQMGIVGEKLNIEFVISTGDNFYDDGLEGVDDPAFYESFVNIYTAPSLQKIWYNVLGNHDYREIVEFFFVDTTPFVDKYFTEPESEDHTYDWEGVLPRQAYLSELLKDVDSALAQSKAKWKIVVGHHTIKSPGHHGNTQELEEQLVPILKANKVTAYINGHDHCVEHIIDTESGIHYLTSGGGSKAWRGDVKPWNPEELKLYYDGQGFMSVQITKTNVDIVFYDVFGKALHTWSITKELNSVADI
ncbi:purple acid phosphatase 8-like isoform X2 [Gastrolobium bilobum]|uniref:purple acid phosphatase 8-like isoform X2 n=1 Tax=Gastrolobium bilobum TaxID=150636 RepID=UPI002AB2DEE6|nr:purple acid phosphatase 8-like isoform X2 [Gastrolobium bilobum]